MKLKNVLKAIGVEDIAPKISYTPDLNALAERAILEKGLAKAPVPLAKKVSKKVLKEITPETAEEKALKAERAAARSAKNLQTLTEIQSFVSEDEYKMLQELAHALTSKSALEKTTYDFKDPRGNTLALSGTSKNVSKSTVIELQKAAKTFNDPLITQFAKLVTTTYLSGLQLPSELVADLTGILRANSVSKSGKVSTRKLNYANEKLIATKKLELLDCIKTIKSGTYTLTKKDAYRIKKNGQGKAFKVNNDDLEGTARSMFNEDTPEIFEHFTDKKGNMHDLEAIKDPILRRYAKVSNRNYKRLRTKRRALLEVFPNLSVGFETERFGPYLNRLINGTDGNVYALKKQFDPEGLPLGTYFSIKGEGMMRNHPAMALTPKVSINDLKLLLRALYDTDPYVYGQLMEAYVSKNQDLLNYLNTYYPHLSKLFFDFNKMALDLETSKKAATQIHHKDIMAFQLADFLANNKYNKEATLQNYAAYRKTPEYKEGFYNLPLYLHTGKLYGIHNIPGIIPTSRIGEVLSDVRRGISTYSGDSLKRILLLDAVRTKDAARNFTSDTIAKVKAIKLKLTARSKNTTIEKNTLKIKEMKDQAIVTLYKLDPKNPTILDLILKIIEARKGAKLVKKASLGAVFSAPSKKLIKKFFNTEEIYEKAVKAAEADIVDKIAKEQGESAKDLLEVFSKEELFEQAGITPEQIFEHAKGFKPVKEKSTSAGNFNKATVFNPRDIDMPMADIPISGDQTLHFSQTKFRDGNFGTEIPIEKALDRNQVRFGKNGPTIDNPSIYNRENKVKGMQKPLMLVDDPEFTAFKQNILAPTAELRGATPDQAAYVRKHGTSGIVEEALLKEDKLNPTTHAKGFGRLNNSLLLKGNSMDKLKSFLVHENIGHGMEPFLDPAYFKEFAKLGIKDTLDARAVLLEAKFLLWKEAKKVLGDNIGPLELNAFISKVPTSELQRLFEFVAHREVSTGSQMAKLLPKKESDYREALGKVLGIGAVAGIGAGAVASTLSAKKGSKLLLKKN